MPARFFDEIKSWHIHGSFGVLPSVLCFKGPARACFIAELAESILSANLHWGPLLLLSKLGKFCKEHWISHEAAT